MIQVPTIASLTKKEFFMSSSNLTAQDKFQLISIGKIQVSEEEGSYLLQIDPPYRPALKEMNRFSHIMILWWADQMDTEKNRSITTTSLPYAPGIEAGVFACRSEYRPNPIGLTTMMILDVDEENGLVVLPWIDAFDGTPLLDIKPYIPISDRIRDYSVPDWAADWPEWMEDAGAYFSEHEVDFGE
jgi:tRNA-Thr(GGU) m(6)t(6)A37 methyltransferase TsaA